MVEKRKSKRRIREETPREKNTHFLNDEIVRPKNTTQSVQRLIEK